MALAEKVKCITENMELQVLVKDQRPIMLPTEVDDEENEYHPLAIHGQNLRTLYQVMKEFCQKQPKNQLLGMAKQLPFLQMCEGDADDAAVAAKAMREQYTKARHAYTEHNGMYVDEPCVVKAFELALAAKLELHCIKEAYAEVMDTVEDWKEIMEVVSDMEDWFCCNTPFFGQFYEYIDQKTIEEKRQLLYKRQSQSMRRTSRHDEDSDDDGYSSRRERMMPLDPDDLPGTVAYFHKVRAWQEMKKGKSLYGLQEATKKQKAINKRVTTFIGTVREDNKLKDLRQSELVDHFIKILLKEQDSPQLKEQEKKKLDQCKQKGKVLDYLNDFKRLIDAYVSVCKSLGEPVNGAYKEESDQCSAFKNRLKRPVRQEFERTMHSAMVEEHSLTWDFISKHLAHCERILRTDDAAGTDSESDDGAKKKKPKPRAPRPSVRSAAVDDEERKRNYKVLCKVQPRHDKDNARAMPPFWKEGDMMPPRDDNQCALTYNGYVCSWAGCKRKHDTARDGVKVGQHKPKPKADAAARSTAADKGTTKEAQEQLDQLTKRAEALQQKERMLTDLAVTLVNKDDGGKKKEKAAAIKKLGKKLSDAQLFKLVSALEDEKKSTDSSDEESEEEDEGEVEKITAQLFKLAQRSLDADQNELAMQERLCGIGSVEDLEEDKNQQGSHHLDAQIEQQMSKSCSKPFLGTKCVVSKPITKDDDGQQGHDGVGNAKKALGEISTKWKPLGAEHLPQDLLDEMQQDAPSTTTSADNASDRLKTAENGLELPILPEVTVNSGGNKAPSPPRMVPGKFYMCHQRMRDELYSKYQTGVRSASCSTDAASDEKRWDSYEKGRSGQPKMTANLGGNAASALDVLMAIRKKVQPVRLGGGKVTKFGWDRSSARPAFIADTKTENVTNIKIKTKKNDTGSPEIEIETPQILARGVQRPQALCSNQTIAIEPTKADGEATSATMTSEVFTTKMSSAEKDRLLKLTLKVGSGMSVVNAVREQNKMQRQLLEAMLEEDTEDKKENSPQSKRGCSCHRVRRWREGDAEEIAKHAVQRFGGKSRQLAAEEKARWIAEWRFAQDGCPPEIPISKRTMADVLNSFHRIQLKNTQQLPAAVRATTDTEKSSEQLAERQPYVMMFTQGGEQRHIAIDSCCNLSGAICEEQLEKAREDSTFYSLVAKYRELPEPIKCNGVEGKGGGTLIIGVVFIRLWLESVKFKFKMNVLRKGSTGNAFAMLGWPTLRAYECLMLFSESGVRNKLFVLKPPSGQPFVTTVTYDVKLTDTGEAVRALEAMKEGTKASAKFKEELKMKSKAIMPAAQSQKQGGSSWADLFKVGSNGVGSVGSKPDAESKMAKLSRKDEKAKKQAEYEHALAIAMLSNQLDQAKEGGISEEKSSSGTVDRKASSEKKKEPSADGNDSEWQLVQRKSKMPAHWVNGLIYQNGVDEVEQASRAMLMLKARDRMRSELKNQLLSKADLVKSRRELEEKSATCEETPSEKERMAMLIAALGKAWKRKEKRKEVLTGNGESDAESKVSGSGVGDNGSGVGGVGDKHDADSKVAQHKKKGDASNKAKHPMSSSKRNQQRLDSDSMLQYWIPMPKALVRMAVLVATVAAHWYGGQEQMLRLQLLDRGRPMKSQSFTPFPNAYDKRLELMGEALFETDEQGFSYLPVKNASTALNGVLEAEPLAAVHLIRNHQTRQLSEMASDKKLFEQVTGERTAEVNKLIHEEMERQLRAKHDAEKSGLDTPVSGKKTTTTAEEADCREANSVMQRMSESDQELCCLHCMHMCHKIEKCSHSTSDRSDELHNSEDKSCRAAGAAGTSAASKPAARSTSHAPCESTAGAQHDENGAALAAPNRQKERGSAELSADDDAKDNVKVAAGGKGFFRTIYERWLKPRGDSEEAKHRNALDQKASASVHTMSTPWGPFKYTREPMGLIPSLRPRDEDFCTKEEHAAEWRRRSRISMVHHAKDSAAVHKIESIMNDAQWDNTVGDTDMPADGTPDHVPGARFQRGRGSKPGGTVQRGVDSDGKEIAISAELATDFKGFKATEDTKKFEAKFERKSGQKAVERDSVTNASLKQVLSGTVKVESISPAVFDDPYVIPWVDLYCGAGGVGHGSVRRMGKFILVCVLAVDSNERCCQAHRLSHPEVPIVQHTIGSWTQVYELIEKHLPERYWHKLWVHASNPCNRASTQNGTNRDLDQAEADTRWLIGCLNRISPAVWTIENVPPLYHRMRAIAPCAKVVKMQQHCSICQPRKRMLLSNIELKLPTNEETSPTLHQVLGPHKGWHPDEPLLQRDAWSDHKSTHAPSYIVTGGAQYAGAKSLGDFSVKHLLDWRDKAALQSFTNTKQLCFPEGIGEQAKKQMVGNMIPPAFAKQLCIAALQPIQQTILERELDSSLRLLARMSDDADRLHDDDVVSPSVVSNTTEKDDEEPPNAVRRKAPVDCKATAHSQLECTLDRGRHGRWDFHPRLGWRPGSTDWSQVAREVEEKPWLIIPEPPKLDESQKSWHNRNTQYRLRCEQWWKERWEMSGEDKAPHRDTYIQNVRKRGTPRGRQMRDVGGQHYATADANAELQKTKPEWYGKYLEEGEHYATPRTPDELEKVYKEMKLDELPEDKRHLVRRFRELVYEFWVLFDGKMRAVKGVELDLDLSGLKPIRDQPYRWAPHKVVEGKKICQEFCEQGLIQPTTSEWAAPALLVPKPNTTPPAFRLVVDFRKLNKCIMPDRFEPPSCELCVSWLAGKPWRSVCDLKYGFHQCALSERCKKYFSFVTPFGTYAYNRLVMGYVNATAEFQRAMNHSMGDSLWRCCVVMVDDLIVASETEEQHMADLREVFTKLAARGHTIKASKMKFVQDEVEYLGRVSTKEGIKITPRHKSAVLDMPYPIEDGKVDVTRLRSGVGLFKFCRNHIPKCAWLCAPLNDLTTKEAGEWREIHSLCWDTLKYFVVYSKGLHHLDYSKPIYVCTDGSKKGVGGYIYQREGREEHVCSYFSRQTTKDEQKWDTRELELLAVLATLEAHHHLIDGQVVVLQTDHRNLTYLMNMKEPSGRLGRWVLRLSEHKFLIEYRKGKYMEISDCMSRNPQEKTSEAPEAAPENVNPEYEMLLVEQATQHNGEKFYGHYEIAIQPTATSARPKAGGEEGGDLSDKSDPPDGPPESTTRATTTKQRTTESVSATRYGIGRYHRNFEATWAPSTSEKRLVSPTRSIHSSNNNQQYRGSSSNSSNSPSLRAPAHAVTGENTHARQPTTTSGTPGAPSVVPTGKVKAYRERETDRQREKTEGLAVSESRERTWEHGLAQNQAAARSASSSTRAASESKIQVNGGGAADAEISPKSGANTMPSRVDADLWRDERDGLSEAKRVQCRGECACIPSGLRSLMAIARDLDDSDDEADEDDGQRLLRVPQSQRPTLVRLSDIQKAQQAWETTRVLAQKLARTEEERASEGDYQQEMVQYELYEGVVCRVTKNETEHADSLRPFLPPEQRQETLRNYHTSVYGAHRSEKTTFREVASRYFWPAMYEEVREYVSKCDVCQLAKGGRPSRQGLLQGRRYSHAYCQICMDLVGPVHQESGSSEKYLLVIIDPFTHFVWIELVDAKDAGTIMTAFVNRMLLEEGAPRAVLTDNGNEFKNKHLRALMEALEVDHQFSPAYHPQSNQTERANRYIVETLRALVRSPGALARNWQKYVKYVEFAMRRTPIPGTNLTPFMAMRGRDPLLPIDLPLAERAMSPASKLEPHVRQIVKDKELAERLIKEKSEQVLRKNADLRDLSQKEVTFAVGELVRLWGVQHTSNGEAGKLKLRNGVFRVLARDGQNRYNLVSVLYPEIQRTNVDVSFIARWRGDEPTPTTSAPFNPRDQSNRVDKGASDANDDDDDDEAAGTVGEPVVSEQSKLWDKVKMNEIVCFVLRGDPPSFLRTGEVVSIATDKRSAEIHYWIDRTPGKYKPNKPIQERRLVAEWVDHRGNTKVGKARGDGSDWKSKCAPRKSHISIADVEIVKPVLKVFTGGSPKPEHVDDINRWLQNRAKTDGRARQALPKSLRSASSSESYRVSEEKEMLMHRLIKELNQDRLVVDMRNTTVTNDDANFAQVVGTDQKRPTAAEANAFANQDQGKRDRAHVAIMQVMQRWSPW